MPRLTHPAGDYCPPFLRWSWHSDPTPSSVGPVSFARRRLSPGHARHARHGMPADWWQATQERRRAGGSERRSVGARMHPATITEATPRDTGLHRQPAARLSPSMPRLAAAAQSLDGIGTPSRDRGGSLACLAGHSGGWRPLRALLSEGCSEGRGVTRRWVLHVPVWMASRCPWCLRHVSGLSGATGHRRLERICLIAISSR